MRYNVIREGVYGHQSITKLSCRCKRRKHYKSRRNSSYDATAFFQTAEGLRVEDELGKQLLIRGSKKVTLTEDGMLLRKRAEEMIDLMEKQKLQKEHPFIHYHIYSGDAGNVTEKLDKGLNDFGLLVGPVDVVKFCFTCGRLRTHDVFAVNP